MPSSGQRPGANTMLSIDAPGSPDIDDRTEPTPHTRLVPRTPPNAVAGE